MDFLIIFLVVFTTVYHCGRLRGEARERTRHERAVNEATKNITSIGGWRER